MNELLQKHGCSNVFNVPEGLKELMSDITREVLRAQPPKIFDFISNYLSVLIITREHGVMAVKILDDLCDCRPSVTEHLEAAGLQPIQAATTAAIIQEEIEKAEPKEGDETVRETQILKRILQRYHIDEVMTAKVCQIARNAYRDYWYRKRLLEQTLKNAPEQPWEEAAAHTLEIYKRTNPTFNELNRATEKIQAAYRGYYVRKSMLSKKKKKPAFGGPKITMPGPPIDIAKSREIDLGRVINIKVPQDDVSQMFEADVRNKLGLPYDTKRMLTFVPDAEKTTCTCDPINWSVHRTAPTSTRSSVTSIATLPQPGVPQHEEQKSERNVAKIAFAPTTQSDTYDRENYAPKVDEEHALVPAKDTDATDDEVDEDIEDRTPKEGDSSSAVSGATATSTTATDEDVGEEEADEE